ncbi:hypothetical protein AB0M28_11900 [Streptomyces sp. NPDC051940]|uniref:hypothetical protein n=1 Tax=Streptomyces sp. NPDC051940 TaxID=3155675 RepID=UPI0034271FF8
MSNRAKRTLTSAVRGAVVVSALVVLWTSRGTALVDVVPWAGGFAATFAALTWYTWWFYGDSPRALTLQAKAAAQKAERLGH